MFKFRDRIRSVCITCAIVCIGFLGLNAGEVVVNNNPSSRLNSNEAIRPVNSNDLAALRKRTVHTDYAKFVVSPGEIAAEEQKASMQVVGKGKEYIPVFPDSVLVRRFASINSAIPLDFNDKVKRYIEVYTVEKRKHFEIILERMPVYYPLFDEILSEYKLPLELKHLTIIESALNPHAVSRSGATGIWQFMYRTAGIFDLKMNYYIDERKDPYRSTQAAATYLAKLYEIYDDWLLAIAAYNCGPGTMNKAIRRSGGKRNFWQIVPYLPIETRNYIPAFIAVNYVMNFTEEHLLFAENDQDMLPINSSTVDTIIVTRKISFEMLAHYLDMTEAELIYLNPGFKMNFIPYSYGPYEIKIPCNKMELFSEKRDSIFSTGHDFYSTPDKILHNVRYGETLSIIARESNCTVRDIMEWNYLKNDNIYENQLLTLFIFPPANVITSPKLKKPINRQETLVINDVIEKSESVNHTTHGHNYVFYKISPGDTLWDIAKRYPDSNYSDLKGPKKVQTDKAVKPGLVDKMIDSG